MRQQILQPRIEFLLQILCIILDKLELADISPQQRLIDAPEAIPALDLAPLPGPARCGLASCLVHARLYANPVRRNPAPAFSLALAAGPGLCYQAD